MINWCFTFIGFFAILKRRSVAGLTDEHAPHFSKVEDLAESDTEQFLIGGQNRVQAFYVVGKKEDNFTQQERKLFPGDKLRKGKILVCETKKKKGLLRRNSIISEKYLACTDEADREILIPFSESGFFYSLSTVSGKQTCPVMQMCDIVAKKYLPCVVKLVYGRVPNTPCFFSGLLKLDQAHLERSVIASTIMNLKNILIELPASCDIEFSIAITNEELQNHKGYKNAIELCSDKIYSYMRNMKVCHRVIQDLSDCDILSKSSMSSDTEMNNLDISCHDLDLMSRPMSPPPPEPHKLGRDSGYIPMNQHNEDDEYVRMTSLDNSHPDLKSKQTVKLFVENDFMEIAIRDSHDDDESEDNYSDSDSITIPVTPLPVPCVGTAPPPCSGSPNQDSGISDDGLLGAVRRPSTFLFTETEVQRKDDDVLYDVPANIQSPSEQTRRSSAPCDTTFTPRKSSKSNCLKRPSLQYNKEDDAASLLCNVHNTIHEHHEQHDYYHDDEPCYANIATIREMAAAAATSSELDNAIPSSISVWNEPESNYDGNLSENPVISNKCSNESQTQSDICDVFECKHLPNNATMHDVFEEDPVPTPHKIAEPINKEISEETELFPDNPTPHFTLVKEHYTIPCTGEHSKPYNDTGVRYGSPYQSYAGNDDDVPDEDAPAVPPTPHIGRGGGYCEIESAPVPCIDMDGYDKPSTSVEDDHPYIDIIDGTDSPMQYDQNQNHTKEKRIHRCHSEQAGFKTPPPVSAKPKSRSKSFPKSYSSGSFNISSSVSIPALPISHKIPPIPSPKPHKISKQEDKQHTSSIDSRMSSGPMSQTSDSKPTQDRKSQQSQKLTGARVSTSMELEQALCEQGVKKETRDYIVQNMTLEEFLDVDLENPEDKLPHVGSLDLRKISMCIRTWKI